MMMMSKMPKIAKNAKNYQKCKNITKMPKITKNAQNQQKCQKSLKMWRKNDKYEVCGDIVYDIVQELPRRLGPGQQNFYGVERKTLELRLQGTARFDHHHCLLLLLYNFYHEVKLDYI